MNGVANKVAWGDCKDGHLPSAPPSPPAVCSYFGSRSDEWLGTGSLPSVLRLDILIMTGVHCSNNCTLMTTQALKKKRRICFLCECLHVFGLIISIYY